MRTLLAIGALLLAAAAGGASALDAAPKARPDLSVARLVAPPGGAATLELRDAVRVSGRAGRTVVRYYLSRDRRRSRDDRRLTGSRTVTARSRAGLARVRVPAAVPRAAYFVVACADDTQRVRERNERNNCRASAGRVTLLEPFSPRPVDVTETVDAGRAASADVGPAGGSLTATAADGTQLTLDVPAGALDAPVAIRMIPLAGVAGLPGGATLVAGARLEPGGLQFLRPATLTVAPASAVPVGAQRPFATENGKDLRAYPVLGRRAIALPILHFSTYGLASGSVLSNGPSTRVTWAEQSLARTTARARFDAVTGLVGRSDEEIIDMVSGAAYVALYVVANEWVGPLLRQAQTDRGARRAAIVAYTSWLQRAQLYGVLDDPKLAEFARQFEPLYEQIFRLEVNDAARDCEEGRTGFGATFELLSAVRQATLAGILDEEEGAEFTGRLRRCLRFELTMTSVTSWTVDDFARATSQVRASGQIGVIPLEATEWDVQIVGDLAEYCVAANATYAVDRPLAVVGLNVEPDDDSLARFSLDVVPGRDALSFGLSCNPDVVVPPQAPGAVHQAVWEQSHVPEKVGTNGVYRLTGWRRVPGAGWAAELLYERSQDLGDWSWTESTRFFLRHAPLGE